MPVIIYDIIQCHIILDVLYHILLYYIMLGYLYLSLAFLVHLELRRNRACADEHVRRRVGTPGKIHMYLYVWLIGIG